MIPIDATVVPMESNLNHDVLFQYIRYAFFHYVPNKPNKKKMKQWIEALPYFLPEEHQNIFFTLIHKYPLETYWDTRDNMNEYGYILYSSFYQSLKKTHATKEGYDIGLYKNKSKEKQIHTLVFVGLVLVLLVAIYRIL
jgi:hypothetical protein